MTEIMQVDLGIRVTEVWGKACNLKGEHREKSFYPESPQGGHFNFTQKRNAGRGADVHYKIVILMSGANTEQVKGSAGSAVDLHNDVSAQWWLSINMSNRKVLRLCKMCVLESAKWGKSFWSDTDVVCFHFDRQVSKINHRLIINHYSNRSRSKNKFVFL